MAVNKRGLTYTLKQILEGQIAEGGWGKTLNGKWLFKEWNPAEKVRSINDWRTIFVNELDLTEFEGSKALGFTWQEWKDFKKEWLPFSKEILPSWMEEIEITLRSRGLKSMISRAASDDSAAAAKWLAESKWKEIHTKKDKEKDEKQRVKTLDKVANDDSELDKVFRSVSNIRPNK